MTIGQKRAVLALMLSALGVLLTGCFVQPDPSLEPLTLSDGTVPFGTVASLPTAEPTPSPVPTATPVPTLMETIQETVKPIHLIIGGVVLAVLVLLLIFFRMRAGMQQKSVEKEAIDTISIASDVRDSSGKRRKTRRKEPAREKTKKPASSGKKASTEKTSQEKPEDDVKLYEKHYQMFLK